MFDALEASLELIESLRKPVARLRRTNPDLHRQIRRAASSIALNLAEGRQRRGGDRRQLHCVALGSAEEVRAALRVAHAWGDLDTPLDETLQLLDRVIAMLWKLTR